ncbi:DUF5994 family protein [Actinosynnema sp. NPDC023587]|uniref:DUF5994 family protein n=1 Tax=Actinosynnema sp. NPDC023587 TaxID=3154695 RepID=UPI0034043A77
MTSGPPPTPFPADRSRPLPRLRLKPPALPVGHVDGAWWPRSRDLVAELPALAGALADRLGVVERVVFARTFWGTAPEHVEFDGRTVTLLGFAALDTDVVQVSSTDHRHVDLLVVPPDADGRAADRALALASASDHTRLPAQILAAAGIASGPTSGPASGSASGPASGPAPAVGEHPPVHRTRHRTHSGRGRGLPTG